EAISKPVKYVPIPVAAMVEGIARMGLGDFVEVAYRDYLNAYSQGWQSQVTDAVKRITGKEPRTIHEFARRNAAAFGANEAEEELASAPTTLTRPHTRSGARPACSIAFEP